MQHLLDKLFRDDEGRFVVFQIPNFLFWFWLCIKLISFVIDPGHLKDGLSLLSSTILFTWAYLETTKGVNLFRKALGLAVLLFVVWGYFR